jgi:hypothetical protein
MKNIILALGLALTLAMPAYAEDKKPAEPETKKVCVPVLDKEGKPVKDKNGKPKEECRTVKKHKKHEGTEIPPAKK